jgi:hypothetical protein
MNIHRSKSRSFSIPSIALAFLLGFPALATEVPLQAFSASYDLYRGNLHVGTAELSLAPSDKMWRWQLNTRARGIYALLTRRKPYSETAFKLEHGGIRLQSIEIRDGKDGKKRESASFDWQTGQVKTMRKDRQRQFPLAAEVYDYQSIHLLTAAMQLRDSEEETVDFYRKGKIVKSTLSYTGEEIINVGDEEVRTRAYRQIVDQSSTVLRYFYRAEQPLAPVLIENRKGDNSPITFRLREVTLL